MDNLYFPPEGAPECLEAMAPLPQTGFLWLDFDREKSPDWSRTVQDVTGIAIHENHVRDSFNLEHPSFTDWTETYEMIIFRGLGGDDGSLHVRTRPTAIFLLERCLITVRPPDSHSVPLVRQRIAQRKSRVPRTPAGLTHLLLSSIVDRYLSLREQLTERIGLWQSQLLDPLDPFQDWALLLKQKVNLRSLEILSEEQYDALTRWLDETEFEIDGSLRVRFADLQEHIQRVMSFAEHIQTQLETSVQMHFSSVAHRTNEIVRTLTVLSAIFLPLTFVAGVFGMNFQYMPELQFRYAYFIVLACMVALGVGLFWFFRRRKWL